MKGIFVKDRSIKIYSLISTRDSEGFEVVKKVYIHPIDKTLCAYFRQLKSAEIVANKQSQDDTEAFFIINRRAVEKDMFIEYINRRTFGTQTYQITGVDPYDDKGSEIKLNVKKVGPSPFDYEEGVDW